MNTLKARAEQAVAELDRRLELARKHNRKNYWLAAEAAAEDATVARRIYRNSLPEDAARAYDLACADALLESLSNYAPQKEEENAPR